MKNAACISNTEVYIYRFDKKTAGSAGPWRCSRKDCRGRDHVGNEGATGEVSEHNHVNPEIGGS